MRVFQTFEECMAECGRDVNRPRNREDQDSINLARVAWNEQEAKVEYYKAAIELYLAASNNLGDLQ